MAHPWQMAALVAPVTDEYDPAPHTVHLALPVLAANLPGSHVVQVVCPVSELVDLPATHAEQTVEFAPHN
jgi:hypothetical protein